MYSSFCSIRLFQTFQSRLIKLFLQCTAECQLILFIMILTQYQSMLFIAAHMSVKNSQNADESIKMLIKKSIKKQSKCLVSTLIKMSFTLYTAEFYSLADQLQLRVKKIADWVKCNIIYLKISWNSRAYKIKNTWFQNLIQYIMYWIKYMISSWCLFVQSIFWIWNFINIDLINLLILVLELSFIISNHFKNVS